MQVGREDRPRWLPTGVVLAVCLLGSLCVQATHIIGGDVSMRAIGATPGLFKLQLNQYWDETKTSSGNRDQSVTLLVYRKRNPILVERITLQLQETVPLTFNNAACAALRQLSFTQAKYYLTYQFDVTKYTDPDGYYMVWERCCRNDNLTNVNSGIVAGVAMVFYLEFPPMTKNGISFTNSAPDFRVPNGDYICINKPFTFDAGATDADGDQLKYALVTPLNGYTTRLLPVSSDESPRASYPTIPWGSGYGLTNIIPGNPPLRINSATGQLTVRADREGLYLFTVQCEEYRNGVLIGVVRRDFQLPVVDCSKNTLPPAVVMANGAPATDLNWCSTNTLVLTVEKNAVWAYQWQKDGANLRGATMDTLKVTESGVYTVVKSQAKVCANDTMSQAVKVTLTKTSPVKLTITSPAPYCTGDTLTIQADGQPGSQYQWRRDGRSVTGNKPTIRVYESGVYQVVSKSETADCDGLDSIQVTIHARPTAQLSASAGKLCPDSSVQLTATSSDGYRYAWQQNGASITDTSRLLQARQAGTYQVTVTSPMGCTTLSNTITLGQFDRPTVEFDSLSPVCVTNATVVPLQGQPAGGVYGGVGVQGGRFDPAVAGVGRHQLTYSITSADGCRASASRWAVVTAAPKITGGSRYGITKGATVQLLTQSDQPIRQYRWEPPLALSRTDVASPEASPVETTPYQLTVVGEGGCLATFATLVEVIEPLYIPSAFSPNGDGVNDSWLIPNISSFPQAEVSIYNRWGELLFYSKGYTQPWDGTYRQENVKTGTYTYQIWTGTGPVSTTYRGQLTVIH
ncbi:gliding motility-associated C-terminal domain-containing protein [Spirosoma sp.]|uniref:gliding motility-associated C-terminal domain-containing protein n=1 Tax=Spirosoma sp. TaxID=1899569 RepID=UPI00261928AE|nr:gliding motility-associated C-terminal domain-containing protein [Spirosoma sp.]MCX6215186.1 gliding motility-associated C-terminal domain-containing protein [Spirosoma sp.]